MSEETAKELIKALNRFEQTMESFIVRFEDGLSIDFETRKQINELMETIKSLNRTRLNR